MNETDSSQAAVHFDPPPTTSNNTRAYLDEEYCFELAYNEINIEGSVTKIEQEYEQILCKYKIIDSEGSDVLLEERLEQEFEIINCDGYLSMHEEVLEEIVDKIVWSSYNFETKVEFRDTKETEVNRLDINSNLEEANVDKIELGDQQHEKVDDQVENEDFNNSTIHRSLSEIQTISSEESTVIANKIIPENDSDLESDNSESDESEEYTRLPITDIIKRFENKIDGGKAKRSSLGDIKTNSTYFSNRGKRRNSSADIKVETRDDKQENLNNIKSDNDDNETVKVSVKELRNIFDRRKDEKYQNINKLRKKLVHNRLITYAPKILDDMIAEAKVEMDEEVPEYEVETVELEENEVEKRHDELVRFYRDLFENLANPLFMLMVGYCAIYLIVDFFKLLFYICYKILAY
ncbi:hypothetical protein Trydic_g8532 [Trypoxylus dichotomus]